jgi:hypothetical protein
MAATLKFKETIQEIYTVGTHMKTQKYKNTQLKTFITNNQSSLLSIFKSIIK